MHGQVDAAHIFSVHFNFHGAEEWRCLIEGISRNSVAARTNVAYLEFARLDMFPPTALAIWSRD